LIGHSHLVFAQPQKLFNAVADTITWVLSQHGITHLLHYLDDFLFLAAPLSQEGEQILRIALETFKALGIPVAAHKTVGPLTILTFLGILIDTHTFELRLPADKLTQLQQMIRHWITRRSCTVRELESLLGHLSHAATVIVHGRTFLRQLFSLLSTERPKHHFVCLNSLHADYAIAGKFPTRNNLCTCLICSYRSIEERSECHLACKRRQDIE